MEWNGMEWNNGNGVQMEGWNQHSTAPAATPSAPGRRVPVTDTPAASTPDAVCAATTTVWPVPRPPVMPTPTDQVTRSPHPAGRQLSTHDGRQVATEIDEQKRRSAGGMAACVKR